MVSVFRSLGNVTYTRFSIQDLPRSLSSGVSNLEFAKEV